MNTDYFQKRHHIHFYGIFLTLYKSSFNIKILYFSQKFGSSWLSWLPAFSDHGQVTDSILIIVAGVGRRPFAQVLQNSLSGHPPPIGLRDIFWNRVPQRRRGRQVPSKGSLALILPTSWAPSAYRAADGHAFRPAPDDPGSLLHADIWCKQNGVNIGAFLHRLFHLFHLV